MSSEFETPSPIFPLVPDIIERIIVHLAPADDEFRNKFVYQKFDTSASAFNYRKSLYRTARVSRAFSVPALNALWRVMDTLSPFCKMLPIQKDDRSNFPNLSECDLSSLRAHLGRVRIFVFKGFRRKYLSMPPATTALAFLASLFPITFPNLQRLFIPSFELSLAGLPSGFDFLFFNLFLASPLTTLGITEIKSTTLFDEFVAALRTKMGLRHIFLDTNYLPKSLHELPDIKTLHLFKPITGSSDSNESLWHILALPHIEEVGLKFALSSTPDLQPLMRREVLHTSPIQTMIICGEASILHIILSYCLSENLQYLYLRLSQTLFLTEEFRYHEDMLQKMLGSLRGGASSSLRMLEIGHVRHISDNRRITGFDYMGLFNAVWGFNLQQLEITLSPFMRRGINISALLQSVPLLEVLRLPKSDRGWGFLTSDLWTIAIACPKLEILSLNVSPEKEKEVITEPTVFGHPLTMLCVYDSKCPPDPPEYADRLDRLFPHLRFIEPNFEDTSLGSDARLATSDSWALVQGILRVCKKARLRWQ